MWTTRGTLKSNLRIKMKLDRLGRIWGDSSLNSAIDTAILQLQTDNDFNWSENNKETTLTTVTDQEEYDLPSDFQQVDLVKVGNILQKSITRDELLRSNRSSATGTPFLYYIRALKVGLNPIPVTAGEDILVAYRVILPALTSDVSESPFPVTYDEAIYAYSAYILFSDINDGKNTTRAAIRLKRYTDELSKLKRSYMTSDKSQLRYKTTYRSRGTNRWRPTNIIVID